MSPRDHQGYYSLVPAEVDLTSTGSGDENGDQNDDTGRPGPIKRDGPPDPRLPDDRQLRGDAAHVSEASTGASPDVGQQEAAAQAAGTEMQTGDSAARREKIATPGRCKKFYAWLRTPIGMFVGGFAFLGTAWALYAGLQTPLGRDLIGTLTPQNIVLTSEGPVHLPGNLKPYVEDDKGEVLLPSYRCHWKIDDITFTTDTCSAPSGSDLELSVPLEVLGEDIEKTVTVSVSVLKDDQEVAALEKPGVIVYRSVTPSISVNPSIDERHGGQFYAPVEISIAALLNGRPAETILSSNDLLFGSGTRCIWRFSGLPSGTETVFEDGSRNCRGRVSVPNEPGASPANGKSAVALSFSENVDRNERFELPAGGTDDQLPMEPLPVRYSRFVLELPDGVIKPGNSLDLRVEPLPRGLSVRCSWHVIGNGWLGAELARTEICSKTGILPDGLLPGPDLAVTDVSVRADISLQTPAGKPLPGTEGVVATVSGTFSIQNFAGITSSVRGGRYRSFRPNEDVVIDVQATDIENARLPDGWACSIEPDRRDSPAFDITRNDQGICSIRFPAPAPERDTEQRFDFEVHLNDGAGNNLETAASSIYVKPHNPDFYVLVVDESAKMARDWNGSTPIDDVRSSIAAYIEDVVATDATVGIYRFGGGQPRDATVGCKRQEWHTPFETRESFATETLDGLVATLESAEEAPLTLALEEVVRAFNDAPKKMSTVADPHLSIVVLTREGTFCDRSGSPSRNPEDIYPASFPQDVDVAFAQGALPIYLVITDDPSALANEHKERDRIIVMGNGRPYVVIPIVSRDALDTALKFTSLLSNPGGLADACGGLKEMLSPFNYPASSRRLDTICSQ